MVTIVVLIILATISIKAVFGENGLIKRAEAAKQLHEQEKAREILELVLGEAQMKKYEEGLSDKELTDKLNEVGEVISNGDNPDGNQVIVDGYIFEIDRSVPKIIDSLGLANGVIITATINGNSEWITPSLGKIEITGVIKTYSGGNITEVSAIKGETEILDFSIDESGKYLIDNITEDTVVTIMAKDSNGKENKKTIEIKLKVDNIPPTIDTITAVAERMKIKIRVTGTDNESGIKQFNYKITPTDGIASDKVKGIILPKETIEITTTPTGVDEKTYTITITATDNSGNTTPKEGEKIATVTTENYLTVAEAKKIVRGTNLQQYIGTRVKDYIPKAGGIWRVFYYDTTGYFGNKDTLYLKKDGENESIELQSHTTHEPSDGGTILRNMNPLWAANSTYNKIDKISEHCAAWLCDPAEWIDYKTDDAEYAIGAPSMEMFMKSYNVWKENNENGKLKCELYPSTSSNNYAHGYWGTMDIAMGFQICWFDNGPENLYKPIKSGAWLCSPSGISEIAMCYCTAGQLNQVQATPYSDGSFHKQELWAIVALK